MRTEAIDFLPATRGVTPGAALAPGGGDFGAWLSQSMARVDRDLVQADAGLQRLAAGEAQNLHQVMIALEEARLGLQLVVQVRNRLLEAYQEVLRMQI
jgi:flagellar hook-basal body complex protein FliE